jgi:hypothetical protein
MSPKRACLEHLRAGESNRRQGASPVPQVRYPRGVPPYVQSSSGFAGGGNRAVSFRPMELDEATAAVHAARA